MLWIYMYDIPQMNDISWGFQLLQQEEDLRREEEALYEAKREAARAEAKKKAANAKKSTQSSTKHGKYFSIDDDSDLEL